MFDYLRDLTRSPEEKGQEALSAYLDGALTPAESQRVEERLAQDPDLQAQLQEMRTWQAQMRALPARRVPRNFTLDPAVYAPPRREPLGRAYPALRTATALAAVMFVLALGALLGGVTSAPISEVVPVAMQQAVEEADMEQPMESAEADMAEAPAAALMPQADSAPAEEASDLLREKPDQGITLEELELPADEAVGGGAEPPVPPAMEATQSETAAEAAPVASEMARESEPPVAEALAEEAQVAPAVDAAQAANVLLWTTIGLGGLLLLLLILTLFSRRQR